MAEYTAMIFKNTRSNTFIANCFMNNVLSFGKTEEEAITNLKDTIQGLTKTLDVTIKPLHKLPLSKSF